jgi:hypothetical protein
LGEHEGGLPYPGDFEGFFDIHTCLPFLDPEDVANLSMGSIGKFRAPLVWGPSGTLIKVQGTSSMGSIWNFDKGAGHL